MSHKYCQEVMNDYEKLLTTRIGYDVIIYAGENENIKELHAHSLILSARSQYFCVALSDKWAEKKDGKFVFKKPNVSPQFFEIILRFIYCGKIDLTKLQGSEVLKLLIVVDEFNIQSLITHIQDYLIEHQDEFLQKNPIGILEEIYQHETFTNLWNHCLEKICEEPEMLFDSDKFINLKAPLLKLFLKRDDLGLDEIVVWNSLLKWSIAQNPSISQDTTKWSKENITIMERTLHGFIPLIRFYHISSEDFINKVYPLKKLLPEDLVDDLVKFHITPNTKPDIDNIQPSRQSKSIYDSILIDRQYFSIFSSWIKKKNDSHYNKKNIPYNFNLLYRASRDGNTIAAFHAKCDNKGATIAVIKVKNSEQIVGGYNPLQWDSSDQNWSTPDSFIFLFTDSKNTKSAKVGYSNGNHCSIRNFSMHGLGFGGGCDLVHHQNGNWCCNRGGNVSYPTLNLQTYLNDTFNMEDYEVFQVIRK
ncbi:hypothetical protein C1645_740878 [Glomus cerebriforme]|uniref:BTB/POZ domain-containing protein n=1 Tax=Glomus cerebriforme TaxID=658196 RepID=A0A397SJK1_9GLOM|nr:hypothetical protein C1645_740878 [Glomus cerebriforme]